MANELQRVPITINTMLAVSGVLGDMSLFLDQQLTHDKNAEYGDAWQAEGPFLASSRMKDKITRVVTLLSARDEWDGSALQLHANAEGFQDILEMMQYGKMLMLYWIWNDLGMAGTEVASVILLYEKLKSELGVIRERMDGYAAGRELEQSQGENSPRNLEVYSEE